MTLSIVSFFFFLFQKCLRNEGKGSSNESKAIILSKNVRCTGKNGERCAKEQIGTGETERNVKKSRTTVKIFKALYCDIASKMHLCSKNAISQNAHSHSNPLLDSHLSNVLNKIQLKLCRCLSTSARFFLCLPLSHSLNLVRLLARALARSL